MGQCLSCGGVKYHKRYSTLERELATMAAGRRNVKDDYIAQKYTMHIDEIVQKANGLVKRFDRLRNTFIANQPIMNEIMHLRQEIDGLRRLYERFFRDSSWQIDSYVQERKLLAQKGYFELEFLKDMIEGLAHKKKANFKEVTLKIHEQIEVAEKLYDHFKRTGPVIPEASTFPIGETAL